MTESFRRLVHYQLHTILAAPLAHCEGVLGDRRTDVEAIAGLESRIRPAHSLQRTRLGAQLLRAAEIEHGGFSHDAVATPASDERFRSPHQNRCASSRRVPGISSGPGPRSRRMIGSTGANGLR